MPQIALAPPLVTLGKALGWRPLPLTIKAGLRFSRALALPLAAPAPPATPAAPFFALQGVDAGYAGGADLAVGRVVGTTLLADFVVGGAAGTDVRVATTDADGDGRADLLVGSGSAQPAAVRVYPGATVAPGPVHMSGFAWAGESNILKVDVSMDNGSTWRPAKLGRERERYAWQSFEYEFNITKPGSYLLMSRATDDKGRVQPVAPFWNPSGYLWNVIDKVRIDVKA